LVFGDLINLGIVGRAKREARARVVCPSYTATNTLSPSFRPLAGAP